jgi:hypothetical protein
LQLDYFATALEFYVSRPKATKQEKLRDTESLVFEMFLRYMNASALDSLSLQDHSIKANPNTVGTSLSKVHLGGDPRFKLTSCDLMTSLTPIALRGDVL